MASERLGFPGGQSEESAVLLRLPVRSLSAAEAIFATGLADEEIAELLRAELNIPARPSLVRIWRDGSGRLPDHRVVGLLVELIPQLPSVAARRAAS